MKQFDRAWDVYGEGGEYMLGAVGDGSDHRLSNIEVPLLFCICKGHLQSPYRSKLSVNRCSIGCSIIPIFHF